MTGMIMTGAIENLGGTTAVSPSISLIIISILVIGILLKKYKENAIFTY